MQRLLGCRSVAALEATATRQNLFGSTLPDDALRKIFYFVSSTADFYHFQFVCKRFHELLQADEQWKLCEQTDDHRIQTHRERARITSDIAKIKKYQQPLRTNVFVEVLGVTGWRDLLERFSDQDLRRTSFEFRSPFRDNIRFRGDTLAVLGALVQGTLSRWLAKANRICVHRVGGESGVYPVLTAADYDLMEEISQPYGTFVSAEDTPGVMNTVTSQDLSALFGVSFVGDVSYRIVRKLAYIAGIVKMEDSVNKRVWTSFIVFLRRLLVGVHALVDLQDRNGILDEIVEDMRAAIKFIGAGERVPDELFERVENHLRDVSPYRQVGIGDGAFMCPCPGQIVKAASKMGLPDAHVYNADWCVSEGSTKQQEINETICLYVAPRMEANSFPDDDTYNSAEFEEESESSFSIYDEESTNDEDMGMMIDLQE